MDDALKIADEISQAFNADSETHNRIVDHTVFPFARSLNDLTDAEKCSKLTVLLSHENPFTRYWGAVTALSYKVLKKEALTALLNILDFKFPEVPPSEQTEEEREYRMSYGLLEMEVETTLVELFRTKKIGSYPGQVKNNKDYILSTPRFAVFYYRIKTKFMKDTALPDKNS